MTKITPIVDTREKKPLVFSSNNFERPIVKKLDAGDYSIAGLEHLVAIERKSTLLEILSNMTQKRFKDAIKRVAAYEYKIMVCEFDYKDIETFPYSTGISHNVRKRLSRYNAGWITSFLTDIMFEHKIPIIYAGSPKSASYIVQAYLKKVWSKHGSEVR